MTFIIFPIEKKKLYFLGGSSAISAIIPIAPRLTEFKTWMAERFPSPEVRQVTQTPMFGLLNLTQTLGLSVEFYSNII